MKLLHEINKKLNKVLNIPVKKLNFTLEKLIKLNE